MAKRTAKKPTKANAKAKKPSLLEALRWQNKTETVLLVLAVMLGMIAGVLAAKVFQ